MTGTYAVLGWLGFLDSTEPAELAVLIAVASVYAVLPAGLFYLAISGTRDDEGETEGGEIEAADGKGDETVTVEE
ncbi:MAG: hypothetical protein ACI9QA_000855 [Methanobacteriota archaeon]|jgi:hypothetical protein